MINLFEQKQFVSHSGIDLTWKLDCDALTNLDIETLAYIISKCYSFEHVVGVPTGGIRLATALNKYKQPKNDTLLIVDDVITTGASMRETRDQNQVGWKSIKGVVIFGRNTKPVDNWIDVMFQMTTKFSSIK